MKCPKCGSERGFRGEQPVEHRKRSDGMMEIAVTGPEKVFCKACGAEVVERETPSQTKTKQVGDVEVVSGVPPQLKKAFFAHEEESDEE